MTERSNNIFLSDGKLGDSLKHGSLFSGIGGFDLAAEWMGWENVFHCEWNEFGQRILKHYWPKAISYEDITKTDFSIHRGKIDILTGGFPCQPYSSAGKRLGKEDDRHLWPEMLRAIREIKPKYVVAENVSGLISWNDGLVFNEVQADLENEGYKVQPCVLPAAAVNAPHRRDRVWFIAINTERKSNGEHNARESKRKRLDLEGNLLVQERRNESSNNIITSNISGINTDTESEPSKRMQSKQREISKQEQREFGRNGSEVESKRNVADTECKRQQEQGKPKGQMRSESFGERKASWTYYDGRWPTQSPICSGNDGISNQLDGITFPKWRQESIKAYGNAIVPQVAFQIFKALILAESKEGRKKILLRDDKHESSSLAQV